MLTHLKDFPSPFNPDITKSGRGKLSDMQELNVTTPIEIDVCLL